MEPEVLLLSSQESYSILSELGQSRNPYPASLQSILILFPHLHLDLWVGLFPVGFTIEIL
jgi:hypothetical protein